MGRIDQHVPNLHSVTCSVRARMLPCTKNKSHCTYVGHTHVSASAWTEPTVGSLERWFLHISFRVYHHDPERALEDTHPGTHQIHPRISIVANTDCRSLSTSVYRTGYSLEGVERRKGPRFRVWPEMDRSDRIIPQPSDHQRNGDITSRLPLNSVKTNATDSLPSTLPSPRRNLLPGETWVSV